MKCVDANKIDLFKFYEKFGDQDNGRIGRTQFDYVIKTIYEEVTEDELN